MSSKPTRVRKVANRNPTSLALPAPIPIPDVPVDPIDQIDPQLTNIDVNVDTAVDVVYSPFSDACVTPPSIPSPIRSLSQSSSPTPANTLPESSEAVVIEDDPQPANTTQVLQATKKGFTWSFIMEQTLFNKLLSQANNRKRANNGFKKEA
jgi:hypothetical protein